MQKIKNNSKVFKPKTRAKTFTPSAPVKESWRSDKRSAHARGYTYKWQKYRIGFLKEHPLCLYCERLGYITEATVVDHIVPHKGDKDLFWDTKNHQALCKTCHDVVKAKEEKEKGY